ncbi:MAG: phytoene/squalene synthase family protein [Tepidisphaeraceae bacterium]
MAATDPIPFSLLSAYDAARRICKRHARSFYFASYFLPRPKRDHAYAVYAFCRLLDDAADEEPSIESVQRFEQVLDRVYGRREPNAPLAIDGDPSLSAFAHTVIACAIPKQYFLDLAEGCRMDFTISRYATWPDLERYCYHVAGVVGLVMCRVFGLMDERALGQAVQMGNAMQLTNILRDVKEDFARGRVYLPQDELARFGVSEKELARDRSSDGLKQLVAFNIDRARSMYREASRGLVCLPDDGSRLTACVMAVVYAGILGAIEKRGGEVLLGRARTTLLQKLWRVRLARRLARQRGVDVI